MKNFFPLLALLPATLLAPAIGFSQETKTPPPPATQSAAASALAENKLRIAQMLDTVKPMPPAMRLAVLDANDLYRRSLAAWKLGEICDVEKLAAFFEKPENRNFAAWLAENPKHLETYLINRPAIAKERGTGSLQVWAEIWKKDADSHDGLWLRAAIGQALETPGNADAERVAKSVERYEFMKRSVAKKKFFSEFETLAPWEIRYVANTTKPISEAEWCQKYIAEKRPDFSPDKIGGSGYAIPYRLKNYAGVSVHKGGAYYDFKPVTFQLQTEYGGVCGAISTLGAWFGISHGIPAFPVGQPGHCALIFRPKAHEWRIGNGISGWNKSSGGSPHVQWGNRPAQIMLFDEFMKNDDGARASNLAFWTVQFAEETKKLSAKEIVALCEAGLSKNVFNYDLTVEYARALADAKASPADFKRAAGDIAEAWKMHPLLAADTVQIFTEKFVRDIPERELVQWIDSVGNAFGSAVAGNKGLRGTAADSFANFVAGELRQLGLNAKVAGTFADGKSGNNFWKSLPPAKHAAVETVLQAACGVGLKNPEITGSVTRAYFNICKDDPARVKTMQTFFDRLLAQACNEPKKDAAISLSRMLVLIAEDTGDAEAAAKNTFYALQQRLDAAPGNHGLWKSLVPQLKANAEEFSSVKTMTKEFLARAGEDKKFSEPVRKLALAGMK